MESQKRAREETLEIDSSEEKKLRFDEYDELLLLDDILEESDPDPNLDSVIKSLEVEISNPGEAGSGLVVPEFGYLLEASDDELGLPPPSTTADGERVEARELLGFGENWGFEDEADFGAAEFGFVDGGEDGGCGGEYLALDGLFDFSDGGFGSTEVSWRSESMPAQ